MWVTPRLDRLTAEAQGLDLDLEPSLEVGVAGDRVPFQGA